MSTMQSIATIGIVILGTMITRFLPFIIFPEGKTPPSFIKYLGTVLPYAVIGLLVVYSIKDGIFTSTHGLPEFIAIFLLLYCINGKNMFISMGGGTIIYMILVQRCFG